MPLDDVTLLQGERRVLEMVAAGMPLRETLEALIALIEVQDPGLRCGVLVMTANGKIIGQSYGPKLPAAYHDTLVGLPIKPPYIGACAEVAHRGTPVVLHDLAHASAYAGKWLDLVASCGLASLCSTPIVASDGAVLGSFAMYRDQPGNPVPRNQRLTEVAAHLAGIALERARFQEATRERDSRLRASAEQFAALIENAPFGTYVIDAGFRLTQASQIARAAFGSIELVGMDLGDALRRIWPERFASEAIGRFRHTLATGEPFVATDTVEQRADIEAVQAYDWRTERIVMPDGGFGVVCYFYDLTERQRMEAELRASEARFASAFEQSPNFMTVLSGPDHVFEVANPAYLKLIGQRDILGRPVAEAVPDVASQGIFELLDRVYRTGEAYVARSARIAFQRVPGGPIDERFVDFVYQPITDAAGQVVRIFVEGSDVTDRVRAEAKLRESEERFRLIVSSARDFAIITLDMEGLITGWNTGAEQMLGYAEADILGKPGSVFFTPEDTAAGVPENEMRRAREAGRADNERWHIRRNGSRFWGSGLVMPLSNGHQRGYLKIFQDKTAAHEAGTRLEQAVKERTRELETAQARLAHVQRMEALGQLAGGIAHDFNNVLQAVQGGAGLIERRPNDPEAVRRLARMVFDSAGRGSAITRRLLAFSRRGDLRAEAVDPVSLLVDLREILTHTLGTGIGVRVDAATSLPPLIADKGQLETVLINMATNARDAMSGSGVLTLTATIEMLPKADGPRPVLDLKAGSYVRLGVSDTGSGITAEVLARVSEPFFTTKPQGQGTGLGLAMARGFIEQSGGAMLLESQPGQGTTVNIWLPVADAASLSAEPYRRVEDKRRDRTARLLVVDDEPLVREIIVQQLQAAGHSVISVNAPQEALALLDAGEPIDLLVSDLSMPGMDGIALVQEANRRRPTLPTILLTGFATNAAEIAVGGAVSGLFSLLRKPVTEQELAERVAMLLEGPSVDATPN